MIASIPEVAGIKPVTPVGSPLKEAETTSVVKVPVAVAVWAEVHAPLAIKDVASAVEPLATV